MLLRPPLQPRALHAGSSDCTLSRRPRLLGELVQADRTFVRWTLILAEPGHVPIAPWHDPAAVAQHITTILPGTVFDSAGTGRFERRTYAITFHLPAGDPGVLEVEATDPAAEAALLRVAQKAGWGVIDEHGRTPAAADVASAATPQLSAPSRAGADTPPADRGALAKAGAAVVVAIAIAVGAGMRWSQLQRDAAVAAAPAAAPAPVAAPAVVAGPRGRMTERFRDHPVALQLVEYVEASMKFQKQHGRDAWVNPAALAWRIRFVGQLDASVEPFLPPAFRSVERDGYRFTFEGRDCGPDPREGPGGFVQALELERCRSAVYIAQPVNLGQPSFAFHSEDLRIRFREDAVPPSPGDAVVVDLDPKAPAPAPAPVTQTAAAPPAPAWVGKMWDTWESAVGAKPPQTLVPRTAQEGPVEADLRAVAAAQKLYARRDGGGHFTDLERLMRPSNRVGQTTAPLLPAAFATLDRHGYRFEFIGTPTSDEWTQGQGKALGPHFGAFVYVAHPPDPKGRTLAIFTDAGIRVATGRVPTAEDRLLGNPQ